MPKEEEMKMPELVKTIWGFYQYQPLPSDEDLHEYYATKYYQEGLSGYEISYSEEEVAWKKLRHWLFYRKAAQILPDGEKTFLDVGCGEGWLMEEFYKNGHSVRGLDFSKAGIEKLHPHLLPFLQQGNIYELLENIVKVGGKFDIIGLCHVIEHVKWPRALIENIKSIMHSRSLLIISAPNDFSLLHKHLIEKKMISREWWLGYPEHLSYFNCESMCNFLDSHGFMLKGIMADNPIDLNLLNDNSNYIEDKTKGKNTHFFRIRMDNFLGSIDREKLLTIYEILGSMGVGRNLIYYFSLKT